MQPRAQHQSRIKLEHDFHIDQVEPEISNQKKHNHDSNMKFWNVFNSQHRESQKIHLKSDAPQGPTQIQNQTLYFQNMPNFVNRH